MEKKKYAIKPVDAEKLMAIVSTSVANKKMLEEALSNYKQTEANILLAQNDFFCMMKNKYEIPIAIDNMYLDYYTKTIRGVEEVVK